MTQEEFNAMLAVGIAQGLPGSYYTSRYGSGEEIDRRLGNAAVPAVGENILINADFRNPVNQRGQTEYTTSGYCIDRWKNYEGRGRVSLQSEGISLYDDSRHTAITQLLDLKTDTAITVTLSALFKGSIKLYRFGIAVTDVEPARSGEWSIATFTYDIPAGTDLSNKYYPFLSGVPNEHLLIKAAKLELGDAQTLAQQNADGKWELIVPPNYPLQYALCSQYSPGTGEWVGNQHSNPNLLINSYFVGGGSQRGSGQFPINQRGLTEYPFGQQRYVFDRWMAQGGMSVKLNQDCITLFSPTVESAIFQKLEFVADKDYTFTLSVIYRGEVGLGYYGASPVFYSSNTWDLASYTFSVPYGTNMASTHCPIVAVKANASLDVKATKLELGSIQTLARKKGDAWVLNAPPPNYALELLKCQRYQLVLGNSLYAPIGIFVQSIPNRLALYIPTPTTLRANPTVIIQGGFRLIGPNENVQISPTYGGNHSSAGGVMLDLIPSVAISSGVGWIDAAETKSHIILDCNL